MSSAAHTPSELLHRRNVAAGLLSALGSGPRALEAARRWLELGEAADADVRRALEAVVREADTVADYPETAADPRDKPNTKPRRSRVRAKKRGRKPSQPPALVEALAEATYVGTGTGAQSYTPWGGASGTTIPYGADSNYTLRADADDYAGGFPPLTRPPNLRDAEGWESCGNCVFFAGGQCNLYGYHRDGERAEIIAGGGFPVDDDDLCDSHRTVTPPEQQRYVAVVTRAAARLAEAVEAGDNAAATAARARYDAAAAKLLSEYGFSVASLARKGLPGPGRTRRFNPDEHGGHEGLSGALRGAGDHETVHLKHSGVRVTPEPHHLLGTRYHVHDPHAHFERDSFHKTPEEAAQHALNAHDRRVTRVKGYAERRGERPFRPSSRGDLAKIRSGFGDREAAHRRERARLGETEEEALVRDLREVKSAAYPGLDRSPKENWVDKAGGLPSYIERIAKHLHYEKGKAIGHAIAIAVNVVKKMCASGDTNFPGKQSVNPKSRAEACAAVASWEKKKAGRKVKESALQEWFDRGFELYEGAHKAIPPSWNFVEKTLAEIAAREGPDWHEGLAKLDEAVELIAEHGVDDVLERELVELHVMRRLGVFDPAKHPRTPKGHKGGGQFAKVMSKLEDAVRASGDPTKDAPGSLHKDLPGAQRGLADVGDRRPGAGDRGVASRMRRHGGEVGKLRPLPSHEQPERHRVSWRGVMPGVHSKTFASREEAEKFQRETLGAGPVVPVGRRASGKRRPSTGGELDSRTRSILHYAETGSGRSYGGGLADYDDEDIRRALGHATSDKQRAALESELASRGPSGKRRPPTGVDRALGNQVGGPGLEGQIRAGDRVTIRTPHGQERTGRAVMRGPAGWVLNMGGAHGTPGIADERNIVKVSPKREGGKRRAEPDFAVDHAISSALAGFPDLKDWDVDGPHDPPAGSRYWHVNATLASGAKHRIRVHQNGEVRDVTGEGDEIRAKMAALGDGGTASAPGRQGNLSALPSAAAPPSGGRIATDEPAQTVRPVASGDLEATGDYSVISHMRSGQAYRGHDEHLYRFHGDEWLKGKKGRVKAAHVENLDTGVHKNVPYFAVHGKEYELMAPRGDARRVPHHAGPSDSVLERRQRARLERWRLEDEGEAFSAEERRRRGGSSRPTAPPPGQDDVFGQLLRSVGGSQPARSTEGLQGRGQAAGGDKVGLSPGTNVVVTGVIPGHTREEVHALIDAAGGRAKKSVTNDVNVLVTGDKVGATKIAAAQKKGVKVIPWSEFKHLVEAQLGTDVCRLVMVEAALGAATDSAEVVRLRARRAKLEEKVYDAAERRRYATVGGDRYPIGDEEHARQALIRLNQGGLSNEEKAKVIAKAARHLKGKPDLLKRRRAEAGG